MRSRLVASAGGLAVALVVAGLWLATRPVARCGHGLREDLGRAQRVEKRLASSARGRELLARARPPLCFADAEASALVEGGAALLDAEAGDAENAARLGHLLLHAVEGPPFAARAGVPCAALVAEAIAREARAHALELELRRELEVTNARRRYPFEADFWRAPPEGRLALVQARLHAEPRGLARDYQQRCEALRR